MEFILDEADEDDEDEDWVTDMWEARKEGLHTQECEAWLFRYRMLHCLSLQFYTWLKCP